MYRGSTCNVNYLRSVEKKRSVLEMMLVVTISQDKQICSVANEPSSNSFTSTVIIDRFVQPLQFENTPVDVGTEELTGSSTTVYPPYKS